MSLSLTSSDIDILSSLTSTTMDTPSNWEATICRDVKLTGSNNYNEWTWLMSSFLEELSLLGHVDGKLPKLTTAEALSRWLKDEAQVKCVLLQSKESSFRMSFCAFSTSVEIWKYHEKHYSQTSHTLRFCLYCSC